MRDGETVELVFKVKNTGDRSGKETVQIYLKEAAGTLFNPGKTLHGFSKICLDPGAEKEVHFTLDTEDFSLYSPVYETWVMEKGVFQIEVGASCEDIRLTRGIKMIS